MENVFSKSWKPGTYFIRACALIALLGWFPPILGKSMAHGGGQLDVTFMFAGVVIGCYCTLEMVRCCRSRWAKVLRAVWLAPYALFVGWSLYSAAQYVPRLFAT